MIEAPSILGLRPTGVELLPDAPVRVGLLAREVGGRCVIFEPATFNAQRSTFNVQSRRGGATRS